MAIQFNPEATIEQKIEAIQKKLDQLSAQKVEAGEIAQAAKEAENKNTKDSLLAALSTLETEKNNLLNITVT